MKKQRYTDGKYSGSVHPRDVEVGATYLVDNGGWSFKVLSKEGDTILVQEAHTKGKAHQHYINTEKDIYFLDKTK